jgi:hypothetical protein
MGPAFIPTVYLPLRYDFRELHLARLNLLRRNTPSRHLVARMPPFLFLCINFKTPLVPNYT